MIIVSQSAPLIPPEILQGRYSYCSHFIVGKRRHKEVQYLPKVRSRGEMQNQVFCHETPQFMAPQIHLWEVAMGTARSLVCTQTNLQQLPPKGSLLFLGWGPRRRLCGPGAGRVGGMRSIMMPWPPANLSPPQPKVQSRACQQGHKIWSDPFWHVLFPLRGPVSVHGQ